MVSKSTLFRVNIFRNTHGGMAMYKAIKGIYNDCKTLQNYVEYFILHDDETINICKLLKQIEIIINGFNKLFREI